MSDAKKLNLGKAASQKRINPKLTRIAVWVIIGGLFILTLISFGAYWGYRAGTMQLSARATAQISDSIQEQYHLGVQNLEAGEYELARQRFEFVLSQDSDYPGAAEKLTTAMQILYATATPTPVPPTLTPTPTRDLRPIQELLDQAVLDFKNQDWDAAINLLVLLREEDPQYRVVEVDGMLYLALRNRGVAKILQGNDLEGGIYDLALAEGFAPLDGDADGYRNLARLYMFGSSFWEADPATAIYYFGQVASAAPYLRDASGWTARERYRASLIHYGDLLASRGDWCDAEDQYELALDVRSDTDLEATATYASEQCSPPTEVPTETLPPSPSPTWTVTQPAMVTNTPTLSPPTGTPVSSPTATSTLEPTQTADSTSPPATTPTETSTAEPSPEPATETVPPATELPTQTPSATVEIAPTETPTPTQTEMEPSPPTSTQTVGDETPEITASAQR